MKTHVTHVQREFSPAEVAAITGVSIALQRDWRRREILPQRKTEGWSRFTLGDVVEIYVLKFFSDAKFSVKEIQEFSGMAVLPVLKMISDMPGTSTFEGDAVSSKLRKLIVGNTVVGARGRFLAIAHTPAASLISRVGRFDDLKRIDNWLTERKAEGFTALDLEQIAKAIVAKAELPLFRFEIEETEQ